MTPDPANILRSLANSDPLTPAAHDTEFTCVLCGEWSAAGTAVADPLELTDHLTTCPWRRIPATHAHPARPEYMTTEEHQ